MLHLMELHQFCSDNFTTFETVYMYTEMHIIPFFTDETLCHLSPFLLYTTPNEIRRRNRLGRNEILGKIHHKTRFINLLTLTNISNLSTLANISNLLTYFIF